MGVKAREVGKGESESAPASVSLHQNGLLQSCPLARRLGVLEPGVGGQGWRGWPSCQVSSPVIGADGLRHASGPPRDVLMLCHHTSFPAFSAMVVAFTPQPRTVCSGDTCPRTVQLLASMARRQSHSARSRNDHHILHIGSSNFMLYLPQSQACKSYLQASL